jgi:hypothetical protein
MELDVDASATVGPAVAASVCELELLESEGEVADEDEKGKVVEEAADEFVGLAAVVLAKDEVVVLFRKGPDELVGEKVGVLAGRLFSELRGSEVGVLDSATDFLNMVVDEFQDVDEVSIGSREVDSTVVGDDVETTRPEEKMELVSVGTQEARLDFPSALVPVDPVEVEFFHLGEQHDDAGGGPPLGTAATLTLVETVMNGEAATLLVPRRDELDSKAMVLEDSEKEPVAGRPVSLPATDLEVDRAPDDPGMAGVGNELLR